MDWLTRICYNVYRATTRRAYHAGLERKAREMIDAGPHKGIIKAEYRAMAKWMREGAYKNMFPFKKPVTVSWKDF